MDRKIKVLLICLGMVSVSVAALAAWIYFSTQAEIIRYAQEYIALEKQNSYLQEKLDDAQRGTRHWREKSEAVTADLNKLGREHTLLVNQYDYLLKEKESLRQQNRELSEQLDNLETDLSKAEDELNDIMQERDGLSAELAEMKQALERSPSELSQSEELASKEDPASIQLPPIVVKAEPEEVVKAEPEQRQLFNRMPESLLELSEEKVVELSGRIITVNDKYHFVVIDIGMDAGVEKAMVFNVYRQEEKIAELEVIETRKNIAACDIREMSVKRLKINDRVRR